MESPEAFEAFLLWLGQDHASGAQEYEEVRNKLILLFKCRGCPIPDELADITIDRTAMVVQRPDFAYAGDPKAFFRGVARNVYLEWCRKQRKFATQPIEDADLKLRAPETQDGDAEDLSFRLERCLDELPAAKRSLLLSYYQSNKRAKIDARQLLAEREGIGLNALRIQIFRLRNTVRQCMERHLRGTETQRLGLSSHE
jgi:DNA-directed RNA polymerase specialized sigma24 family protein